MKKIDPIALTIVILGIITLGIYLNWASSKYAEKSTLECKTKTDSINIKMDTETTFLLINLSNTTVINPITP